jgi:hypothetical protein
MRRSRLTARLRQTNPGAPDRPVVGDRGMKMLFERFYPGPGSGGGECDRRTGLGRRRANRRKEGRGARPQDCLRAYAKPFGRSCMETALAAERHCAVAARMSPLRSPGLRRSRRLHPGKALAGRRQLGRHELPAGGSSQRACDGTQSLGVQTGPMPWSSSQRRSTTRSAPPPATTPCAPSPRSCGPTPAPRTASAAPAARSSPIGLGRRPEGRRPRMTVSGAGRRRGFRCPGAPACPPPGRPAAGSGGARAA